MSSWGHAVTVSEVGGIPYRAYAERLSRMSEVFAEGRRWTDRLHHVCGDRRITFGEHDRAVHAVALDLRHRGVGPGDRVALFADNSPEWLIAMWATLQLGAVAVPFNAWWSHTEVEYACDDAEPFFIVTDARHAQTLPPDRRTLDLDDLREIVAGAVAREVPPVGDPGRDESDPAFILYTSGTTGFPKGVVLSHRSVIANLHNVLLTTGRLPEDADSRTVPVILLAVPLFHLSGLQTLLVGFMSGARLAFLEGRFDPAEVLRLIEEEGVTTWNAVPTMALRVLQHPDLSRRDCSGLRSVTMGGAPVAPELIGRMREAFPELKGRVANVFGMTECGGVATMCAGGDLVDRPDSVGRAMPTVELRIDAEDGSDVGEILIRSPANMAGYWRRPDDPILDDDGWIRSGDVGRIDEEGFLYVLDRSKDLVIRGGENIASVHVESRLLEHDAVVDVAVVGLPHPDLGEEVGAVVVLAEGARFGPEDLRAHAAAELAAFEVPTKWWIRSEPLPTNDVGKVLKRSLRDEWVRAMQTSAGVASC